jgi:hypothetical protein
MPAVVKRTDGSVGKREDDGTIWCPLSLKKSKNNFLSSCDCIIYKLTNQRTLVKLTFIDKKAKKQSGKNDPEKVGDSSPGCFRHGPRH